MAFFESQLAKAVKEGAVDEVRAFIKRGLSVNYAFKSSSHHADAGPDTDAGVLGKTLVEVAVAHGQHRVVELLSRYESCDPGLTMVVDVEAEDCRRVALRPNLKRQRLKMTSMYPCIVKGDVEMIRLLVAAGFDVNMPDDRGCTAVWHAVDVDSYPMARAISSSPRCDVNIPDDTHLYPLHVAAIHANVKIASLLIRRGAAVDALTVRGSTPLVLACMAACYDLARLLLLNGADPNHKGINGHTPISAVLENCTDSRILDLLVEAGAFVDRADVRKCLKDKLPLLKSCPGVLDSLKTLASSPACLKMLCCLNIRKCLLRARSDMHLVQKVDLLPLPRIVKEFLLLNYLR